MTQITKSNIQSEPNILGVLRCSKCRCLVECAAANVQRFVNTGWPVCCNETMSWFTPADRPDRADLAIPIDSHWIGYQESTRQVH